MFSLHFRPTYCGSRRENSEIWSRGQNRTPVPDQGATQSQRKSRSMALVRSRFWTGNDSEKKTGTKYFPNPQASFGSYDSNNVRHWGPMELVVLDQNKTGFDGNVEGLSAGSLQRERGIIFSSLTASPSFGRLDVQASPLHNSEKPKNCIECHRVSWMARGSCSQKNPFHTRQMLLPSVAGDLSKLRHPEKKNF